MIFTFSQHVPRIYILLCTLEQHLSWPIEEVWCDKEDILTDMKLFLAFAFLALVHFSSAQSEGASDILSLAIEKLPPCAVC
jgi:hypothetical protein